MKRYDGSIAVVTGASGGIGRRVAIDLAGRGATVVGLARRRAELEDVEAAMRASSSGSRTITCDVADEEAFRGALADVRTEHGAIDVLINNAAIEHPTPISDGVTTEDYRRLFGTNFFAVVTGTLAVLPEMVGRGSGIVVNVSSDSARAPEAGHAAYSASKAAVSAFTDSVAHEVADRGVHVHVFYPGWVPTAMGMSGIGEGDPLPPKPVRRTEEQVSQLLLERMGGPRVDINAAWLPTLAPIGRTLLPGAYQREMRRRYARTH
ncbi:MAG TPA: SDR family oxidoreductase [Acidimicrobiia bacterium]|jgi:NAD(P)-dependent dehydrogenase (short-subunit alcohol dehydrogenase family)